jgi:hypothetical protein
MRHPLSLRTHARIDICEGGSQAAVMKDSLTLLKHSADALSAQEHVLYINTIASPDAVATIADKISQRQAGKVLTFSAANSKLSERLQFLKLMCVVKNVRSIILTTFDFAAITSKQRTSLVHWLRDMRDGHGVQVTVYAVWPARSEGALAQLAWFADSLAKTGEWMHERDQLQASLRTMQNATRVAEEFSAEMPEVEASVEESHIDHIDSPFALPRDLSLVSSMTVDEFLAAQSLKNKELGGVVKGSHERRRVGSSLGVLE